MATEAATARARKEQRRLEMRSRLRAAMVDLAAEGSFNEMRVAEIAAAAGLSRSAFYFYYRDKRELLIDATAQVGESLFDEAARWYQGSGEPRELTREALAGTAEIWARNADLLRMTLEVKAYDEEVLKFWDALLARFCSAAADRTRSDQEAGLVPADLDASQHAEILVLATERYLQAGLGANDRPLEEVVDVLTSLWNRVLYPAS